MKRLTQVLCLLILAAGNNFADTLHPPTQVVYSSADNSYLFLMQSAVFMGDKKTRPCTGVLFKIDRQKVINFVSPHYIPVWTASLENDFSPLGVLVADDGSFVVTINDSSENLDAKTAVVVYDGEGNKTVALRIMDIFNPKELARIPNTASSYLWFFSGKINSKDRTLELTVWDGGPLEKPDFRKIKIDLKTGKKIE